MSYFFIVTDAISLENVSPHDIWFETQMAFTGGELNYGKKLTRLVWGDLLLMYASKLGVVGVGKVLETWDSKTYKTGQLVYAKPNEYDEYRIAVDWYYDFRPYPLHHSHLDFLPRSHPRSTVERVKEEFTDQIELVLEEHEKKRRIIFDIVQ